MLNTFGLTDIAKNGAIELAITMDGATLFGTSGHVTAGIKTIDPRSLNPTTKKPLFLKLCDGGIARKSTIKRQLSSI